MNVAVYGPGGRWAMTERGRDAVRRAPDRLVIGPSRMTWDGETLTVHVRETCAPVPRPVRGVVRVRPRALTTRAFAIDPRERHRWWPIAPHASIEVEMSAPGLSWHGAGYWDSNWGTESLEEGFKTWTWSRAPLADGGAAILYDMVPHHGPARPLALRFPPGGEAEPFEAPPKAPLPRAAIYRVRRETRCDPGHVASVARTVEDTPFYARSILNTHLVDEPVRAMHESICLDCFKRTIVRLMLPFRMPRVTWGGPREPDDGRPPA
ncbi:carotenoid 1,2-hydratase [Roseospira goensis]|uniref:Carotenoid 1,2-hydratase n=1 Tax=Roseospira goensis TaxID=391922 RepID=A0A7W6RY85_9PROT|nr:carotenoid 1,2-hydratase [Roseospira goensis]MBB4285439.1 carotenoid 1,2-hydratase [Roseospira goensis]